MEAAYYDDPLMSAVRRYHASQEWTAIRGFLPRHVGKALDVGAGRGIASYALAMEGFAVTALEPDGSGLVGADAIRGLVRESGLPIEVTQEFSERLPFPDAHFDLVFMRAALHHSRDLRTACEEFHRVLRTGGSFIAVREHVISKHEDLGAFLDAHPLHKLYGGENAFQLREYESAIRAAGFHIDRVLPPLESPINFAPHTEKTLRLEIARRFGSWLTPVVQRVLNVPGVWFLVVPVLTRVDHRPGRLYSFVCRRL